MLQDFYSNLYGLTLIMLPKVFKALVQMTSLLSKLPKSSFRRVKN